jgi:hypothetical protein
MPVGLVKECPAHISYRLFVERLLGVHPAYDRPNSRMDRLDTQGAVPALGYGIPGIRDQRSGTLSCPLGLPTTCMSDRSACRCNGSIDQISSSEASLTRSSEAVSTPETERESSPRGRSPQRHTDPGQRTEVRMLRIECRGELGAAGASSTSKATF